MRKVRIVRIQKNNENTSDNARRSSGRKSHRKKRGFFSFVRRLLTTAVVLVVAVALGLALFVNKQLSNLDRHALNEGELCISSEALSQNAAEDIFTLAILGVDERGSIDTARSDTIMILSVNMKNGQMSLTTVLRDTYVDIPEYGYAKINAAYAAGGAKGTLSAINANFDMSIFDYVSVDFSSLAAIVDAVGGLTLTVSKEEAEAMNEDIASTALEIPSLAADNVSEGTALLNGAQVLSYARIRYLGNSDFDRTARQRIVFNALLSKIASIRNPFTWAGLIRTVAKNVSTSLTNRRIYSLLFTVLRHKTLTSLYTNSLNNSDCLKSAEIDGADVLVPYSLRDLSAELHKLVYPNQSYTPGESLSYRSDELEYELRNADIETIYTGTTF